MDEIKLNDIADDLLILNKITIDRLFQLDNCADCIALYVFYYKTAKWQKTDTVKANDQYVKKSLKWGISKIKKTKQTLKEHGLIDIVQRRKDGKIEGWFIKVSYLVSERKSDEINIKVQDINNTQNEQIENCTSGNEETNALKEQIKCLKKEIEMLKNSIGDNNSPQSENTVISDKPKRNKFVIPTEEELTEYAESIGFNNFEPKRFLYYYGSVNWMIGKKHMENWKMAVRTWQMNDTKKQKEEKKLKNTLEGLPF